MRDVSTLPGYSPCQPPIPNEWIFKNCVDVELGKEGRLFRCSQPHYEGPNDTPHTFNAAAIDFLKKRNIGCIVSLNEFAIAPEGVSTLIYNNIHYLHLPVVDHQAPTVDDLKKGCSAMVEALKRGVTPMVYCGYGAGRTGTMATALELFINPDKTLENYHSQIQLSTIEYEEQKEELYKFYSAKRSMK